MLVRSSDNNKIMANFMMWKKKVSFYGKERDTVVTNFLAVHSKLRKKKLAQLMIMEAFRRSRAAGL
jgi:predicted N-acetyltransferase YhbS